MIFNDLDINDLCIIKQILVKWIRKQADFKTKELYIGC